MSDASEPARDAPAPSANVVRVDVAGKEIHLLGTAHVSRKSVDEVRRVIEEIRPDSVAVELDRMRYEALADESRLGQIDVRAVLAGGRAGLFLSALLFAGFQKRLGDRLGVRPGAEMLAGVEAAERVGAEVVFADRDVQVTLTRCYRSLGPLERVQVLAVLVMLPFASGDIDEAEIERLKQRETIGDVMQTFAEQMPSLKAPLIDERDQYLAASIERAPGRRVVAVVGAAHVPGVERRLGTAIETSRLVETPAPPRSRALRYLFPILGFSVVLGVLSGRMSTDAALAVGVRLVLPTAGAAVALSLAAGANLVTALACVPLAPLTLLFPFLGFGPSLGRLEARLRPPTPADGVRARTDVLAPRSARKSRFLRPLLVAVFASFGRFAGAAVGLVWAAIHAAR